MHIKRDVILEKVSCRTQFVSIDNHFSRHLPVNLGVPQGSVLGPLLFLIYINDIVQVINEPVQIRLFADDCLLFNEIKCPDDQALLNTSLQNIHMWCQEWEMQLNADKTGFMNMSRKKNILFFPYSLPSEQLTQVPHYKYLGVTITSTLSWNTHISSICSSAFRKLCFLRHKLKHTPSDVKLLAYSSIIRPKLEYASIVWDPHTKKNIEALEMIQRKSVRFYLF